jgi:pimeloyl-ACP methyl ester carboxylesterase
MAEPVIFLPGILMPAALRLVPLLEQLGDVVQAITKELDVYSSAKSRAGYSIDMEVEAISRAANAAGFDHFDLYGHSGGGACALAYVAQHVERVLTLALDEPASDFIAADRAD